MEIAKTYNSAQEAEDKLGIQYWLEKKFFKSTPDHRTPYTIVIPPPKRYRRVAHGTHVKQYYTRCFNSPCTYAWF